MPWLEVSPQQSGPYPNVTVWIAPAVLVVDEGMSEVLLPVVGEAVRQSARIEATEGVMRDEERAALFHAEGHLDAIIASPVVETGTRRKT